ncbi:MAG: FAD-binding protein [Coriobacteriales bacterium]|nr:FAD-binding protein [Coriobacteriales bacterium]
MSNIDRRDFVKGSVAVLGAAAISGSAVSALADASSYTAGTYTATGKGVGYVTVTLDIDAAGTISAATVDVSGETPWVGGVLGETLAAALVEHNDGTVDVIAGATITCDGAMAAAARCLALAKGEEPAPEVDTWDTATEEVWLGAEPVIDEAAITETWDTDILIVGAGNGGMAAAAYAAKAGLNFRVIEVGSCVQHNRNWYGVVDGAAAKAAGCEPVDRRKLLSELSRYASGKCDQRVIRTWINESAAMHDFISGIMEAEPYNFPVNFTSGVAAYWPENCAEENTVYFFPEQETFYFSNPNRTQVFEQVINELGYSVDFYTTIVKLEKDGDRVVGAIAQNTQDGHFIRINTAAGVLLAAGGYAANPNMVEHLDPLSASTVTCYNLSPRCRGMGIRAGLWAGAKLQVEPASMLFDRGLVAPGVDAGYAENPAAFWGKEFPGTMTQFFPGTQPFLKVNRRGERFFNESTLYDNASYASANQPGHVYAQICDANANEDVDRFHTIGCSAGVQNGRFLPSLEQQVEKGLVMKADTIEELADMLGFEGEAKETFLATVARYNELVDAGYDEDFGKPSCRLSAIREAPFYGYWLGSSLLCTMQGIIINENSQVMTPAAEPIPGLYAAGNNAGGFFVNNYPCVLPGTRCGSAMCQAIKAIKQMGGLE